MEETKNKTIGFCTMERFDNRELNSVGSSRIRARWLINLWPEAEEYIIGKRYDVMVFQKVYWPLMMQQYDGIKILDLCDPDWLEGKPVLEFVDLADATITSTQALADYIKKLRPDALVKCIPDRVYIPEHNARGEHDGKATKVAWFGYAQNAHYLLQTFDELIRQGLELTVISNTPYEPPMAYRALKVHNVPYSYPEVNKELAKCDLVIMPEPEGDERAKFKSNNKTLQAWALGLPVAKSADDLDRFASAEERNKERELRLKEISEKWDVRLSVEEYKEVIEQIKSAKNK